MNASVCVSVSASIGLSEGCPAWAPPSFSSHSSPSGTCAPSPAARLAQSLAGFAPHRCCHGRHACRTSGCWRACCSRPRRGRGTSAARPPHAAAASASMEPPASPPATDSRRLARATIS
eukprot:scaffold47192_cov63-Phaeocystis_antarctica.AAC.4